MVHARRLGGMVIGVLAVLITESLELLAKSRYGAVNSIFIKADRVRPARPDR